MTLFSLHPRVIWVKGPRNGALYDLRTGEVIPVLPSFTEFFCTLSSPPYARSLPDSLFFYYLVEKGVLVPGKPEGSPTSSTPKELPDSTPRLLWLEITGRCNYTCIHCYAESSPTNSPPSLSAQRIHELLEEARTLGFRAVQFTGGDPFMHPQLMEFLAHAHKLDFPYVEVYTNGSLCQHRHLQKFREWGTRVALSFYSHRPEVYARITGNPRGYYRVLETIRGLLELEIPFRLGIILMDENREDLEETIGFLRELGVPEELIATDEVRPAGRGTELLRSSCSHSPPRVKGGFVPLNRLNQKLGIFPLREVMRTPRSFSHHTTELTYNTCWSGEIVVDPDGNLYPCIFARTLPLGNVKERGLKDYLATIPVRRVWELTLGSSEECRFCEFRYACFDCRALTLNLTGNLYAKPPHCFYDPHSGEMQWDHWLKDPWIRPLLLELRFYPYPGTLKEEGEGAWLTLSTGIFYLDPLSLTLWELSPSLKLGEIAATIARLRGENPLEWQDTLIRRALTLALEGAGRLPELENHQREARLSASI